MKIEKENIDIVFFDYYEGNLSESEKEAVMNFLHQHPELNDDFTFWAQSYAHKYELPEDYKIAGKLVRGKKGITPGKITAFVAVTVLVVLMFFWLKSPEAEKASVPMKEEKKPKESILPEVSDELLNASKEEKEINTQDAEDNSEIFRMPVPIINERAVLQNESKTIQDDSFDVDHKAKVVFADTIMSQDTLRVVPEKSENETEVPVERPLKRKRKLNLKPDPNIIPVSPDL